MEREEGSSVRNSQEKGHRDEHSLPTKGHFYTLHIHHHKLHVPGPTARRPAACKPASPRFEPGISGSGVLPPEKQRECETAESMSGIQALRPYQAAAPIRLKGRSLSPL